MNVIIASAAGLGLASFLCLYRIGRGPSAPDRAVAVDILGTLVVGFCCLAALRTGQDYMMNIALAWALVSFLSAITLAKYLEGKSFDE